MLGFIIKNRKVRLGLLALSLILLIAGLISLGHTQPAASVSGWNEILQLSQKEKKGLTFYVNGQTVPGIVTTIGDDFLEVKNQTHGRIMIRLASVDAVAMN